MLVPSQGRRPHQTRLHSPWLSVQWQIRNYLGSSTGVQEVKQTWEDLGISGSFNVRDIWGGKNLGTFGDAVIAQLDEGESVLLQLTPV